MTMTLSKRHNQAAPATSASATPEAHDFDVFEDGTIFQQHWNRLCGVLYRLVGDWAEAEDLALEAFVQLYRRPPKEDLNLGGWLYRVATHLGLNALRTRQRRQRYEEQAGALWQEQPLGDPASELESAQEQERVRVTLSAMKPAAAQALVLRHSGFTYAEIAAAIGVSSTSVGTLLARAEKEFEQKYR